jgi:surface antigen
MTYTRQQFCVSLLHALGNNNPTQPVVNFMIGWSLEESGHNLTNAARYNLWNTTQRALGSTFFNTLSPGVGVQNYVSFSQGITANASTLNNGLYPNLIRALQTNNANALGLTGGQISGAIAGDLSVWVNGRRTPIATQYVQAIHTLSMSPGNAGNETAPGTASFVGGVVNTIGGVGTGMVNARTGTSNTFPVGQCTWWSSQRYHQLTGIWVGQWGDAHSWTANAMAAGWNVSTTPTIGCIICFQPGVQGVDSTFGHVNILERFNNDGTIYTSNYNWGIPRNTTSVTYVNLRITSGMAYITYPGKMGLTQAGFNNSQSITGNQPNANSSTGQNVNAQTGQVFTGGVQLNVPQGPNIIGDIGAIGTAVGKIFGANLIPNTAFMDDVHQTLISNPGFYGIALALDEAEEFPGYVDLASSPFDVIGIIRSSFATLSDNFVPFSIRGGLILMGGVILFALLFKLVNSASETLGPLVESASMGGV